MMDDAFDLTDDYAPPPSPAGGEPPWLAGLNPEQQQAVTITEGPLLVLSGAGTGKTRVLTTRLTHIVASRLAPPWRVLAVTFTNRAAREMRDRIAGLIGPAAEQVWLGTFHALALRMLRKHADKVGLQSGFSILDSDDQNRVLKALMEEAGVDVKKWPVVMVMGVIQRWKDRGLTPDQVAPQDVGDVAGGRLLDLYRAYQARLLSLNACDFGDLLLHVLVILKDHVDVLAAYQEQFRYILVDEYQDTNTAQYLWLRLLARGHRNICCVGDDDQSIYSWRGAEVGNILRFEHDFPGAQVVRLERNYRSTPVILGAASALIRNNTGRLGKDLRAAGTTEQGEPIRVYGVWDGQAEARQVVEQIERLQRQGCLLSSMAILVRAGFQTREFEERLITTGTPYRMVGGLRFYERQEIRDAMAYLRLIEQPADDLAFERIINLPKRGLGDAALQTIHLSARALGCPLLQAARSVLETDELKPKPRASLRAFVENIDEWAALREGMDPSELAATVLDGSGYLEMWKKDKSAEAPGRVENLQEFVRGLEDYDSLMEFLEHVSLVMENDSKAGTGDSVTLMTLHAAKGLEFDSVFLPGWEEEVFPNRRALDEGGAAALEEERRLAYVGLTRARKRVFITHASQRRIFRDWVMCVPSRFIGEVPESFREEDSDVGLMGGGHAGRREPWSSWDGAAAASSGWDQRKQAFREREGLSWQVEARDGGGTGFSVGDRVFHQKFGHGRVCAVDGNKLEVDFDKAGRKKVIDSFVSTDP